MTGNDLDHAPVVAVQVDDRGPRVVTVRCPGCRWLHVHPAALGPRVAPCPGALDDYLVTDPDGLLTGRPET